MDGTTLALPQYAERPQAQVRVRSSPRRQRLGETSEPPSQASERRMRVAFDIGPVRVRPAGGSLYASSGAMAPGNALPTNELTLIGRRRDAAGLPAGASCAGRSLRMPYLGWIRLASSRQGRRAGADIVHYADGIAPVVRHGRTVLTVHDFSVVRQWRFHPWRRSGRPLVLSSPRLADVVLAPSRTTADESMRLCGTQSSKIEIIPYAPQGEFKPADPATAARFFRATGSASVLTSSRSARSSLVRTTLA